ncbi:hypothetical protein CAPSP0001_2821 [Capnocytophaga sputigena ATCC 33612]|nr:hypothetical protein CAPSP0001_2821 [Capnocytophaga sputigena ATCC 33612]
MPLNPKASHLITFVKVLIARRATTFAKVDCLENQSLLNYVV